MRKLLKAICAVLLALVIITSSAAAAFGSSGARYDSNGANISRDPSNGRDFVWFINVGSGTWEFDGNTYTVRRHTGADVSGVLDVHYNEAFRIDSHAGQAGIHVYLVASDGTKVELQFSGNNEIAVGRRTPEGSYVPFKVDLVLEYDQEEADRDKPFEVDFGSGHWNVEGHDITATINGKDVIGRKNLTGHESIKLIGAGDQPIQVRVSGPDEFSALLEIAGDTEVELSRVVGDFVLPPALTFTVEAAEGGPGEGRHTVDFGSGSWTVDGKVVYAAIGGSRVSGTVDVDVFDHIALHGLDQDIMSVRVYADDGFSAGLQINGDNEVSLSRLEGDYALPVFVHFDVYRRGGDQHGPDGGDENAPYRFHFERDKMTSEERAAYDKLSDEERRSISEMVRNIVITAKPGAIDADLDKTIWDISGQNGLSPGEDVSYYTIQFDGHEDLDFPVRVTVSIPHNDLPGGRTLYVYHVDRDGGLQYLGEAEITTYDDGNVETLSFYTKSFSDFLISSVKLTKGAGGQETIDDSGSGFPIVPVTIGAVLVIAAVAVIFAVKKKKTSL